MTRTDCIHNLNTFDDFCCYHPGSLALISLFWDPLCLYNQHPDWAFKNISWVLFFSLKLSQRFIVWSEQGWNVLHDRLSLFEHNPSLNSLPGSYTHHPTTLQPYWLLCCFLSVSNMFLPQDLYASHSLYLKCSSTGTEFNGKAKTGVLVDATS